MTNLRKSVEFGVVFTLAGILFGISGVAMGDDPVLPIDVWVNPGESKEKNVGCGFPLIEINGTILEINLHSTKGYITKSERVECNADNEWRKFKVGGVEFQSKWRCEKLPEDEQLPGNPDWRVDPHESFWVIIRAKVDAAAGGKGADPWRYMSVSDVDLDGDTDNDNTAAHRPPSQSDAEDLKEYPTGPSDNTIGLLVPLNDDNDVSWDNRDNEKQMDLNDDELLNLKLNINPKRDGHTSYISALWCYDVNKVERGDQNFDHSVTANSFPEKSLYIETMYNDESGTLDEMRVYFEPDAPKDAYEPQDRMRYLLIGTDIDVDSNNSGTTAAAIEGTNGWNSGEDFYENHPASELTSHTEFKNGAIVPVNDDNDGGDPNSDNGWNLTDWTGPDANVIVAGENDLKPLILRSLTLTNAQQQAIEEIGAGSAIFLTKVSGEGAIRIFTYEDGGDPNDCKVVAEFDANDGTCVLPDGAFGLSGANATLWKALTGDDGADREFRVEGLRAGEVILQVEMWVCRPFNPLVVHTDTVRITVLGLDLRSTGLVGTDANAHVVMRKDGADTYSDDTFSSGGDREIDPNKVWEDADYDDTPEIEDPVCYTIGKTPKLKECVLKTPSLAGSIDIKVKVDAIPSGHSGTVGSVLFGPVDATLPASTTSITVASLDGNCTVGSVVNDIIYDMAWQYSLDGGTTWQRFQQTAQKVFVLLDEPLATYCGDTGTNGEPGYNPLPVTTALARTAKRVGWAAYICKGKKADDIEAGAVHKTATDYTFGDDNDDDPFSHLDGMADATYTSADCISLASIAATALRCHKIDARPARAWSQNKVVPATNTTWGWEWKTHKYHADWWLGFAGPYGNFEGFLHIGEFRRWDRFPSRVYTVNPDATYAIAAGKEKYIPSYVLNNVPTTLRWRSSTSGDNPDIKWKPGNSIAGVSLDAHGVTWTSDPADDNEYNIVWDNPAPPAAKTLKLHNGAAVPITGAGGYTLGCTVGATACTITVTVTDWAALQAAATTTQVSQIVPARTQATVP